MKRLASILVAVFAVVAVTASIPMSSASAVSSAVSSAALSIVPKKNYTIEPGKSIKDTLVIRNLDEKENLNLTLRVVDFSFNDNGGTPKLMLAEDAPQTTWSLKPFMKVPATVTIPPKQSKTLDMNVAIPAGHGAGSYYSAIVYSSGSGDGGNVGLSASGVTLVFTSIPGKVNEDLKLEKFGAYDASKNGDLSGYFFSTSQQPKTIAYTLKNSGNVTEAPVGSISLKDMFGRERTISDVNPNGSLALIGQSRTYSACIQLESEEINLSGSQSSTKTCANPGLWPGYYRLSLNLMYGQNGNMTKDITGKAGFWYLPWWFVLLALIILLVVGFYTWKIVRFIREKLYGATPKKRTNKRR